MDLIQDSVLKSWSLDCDNEILKIMENFGTKLESKASQTKRTLDEMSKSLEKAAISLNNATNKLGNMQHKQFIENLVKEDDDLHLNTKKQQESTEQVTDKKPDPIQILDKILGNNVKMLDTFYEKIAINLNDDSDDEGEGETNAIYRPRNLYHERPLPYIFGSKEWTDHWHVGLCDSDDSFSEDEIEEFSDEEIPAPTPSESEMGSVWNLNHPPAPPSEASSSTKDELFRIPAEVQRESIPDERFYVHKPRNRARDNRMFEESDEESVGKVSVSTQDEKEGHSITKVDLFNEEYNSFMKELEKRVEERVDSSINASVVVEEKKIPSSKVVKKKEVVIKNKIPKTLPEVSVTPTIRPTTKTKISNLFDDEPPDDDFDNLFGNSKSFTRNISGMSKPKTVNLFDDDIESDEFEQTIPSNPIKKTTTEQFSNANTHKNDEFLITAKPSLSKGETKEQSVNSDLSEKLDQPSAVSDTSQVKSSKTTNVEQANSKVIDSDSGKVKKTNQFPAFLDNPPNDDGSLLEQPSPKAKKDNPKIKNSLFDEVDVEDDDDFFHTIKTNSNPKTHATKKSFSKSLFDDEDPDEDIFKSNIPQPTPESIKVEETDSIDTSSSRGETVNNEDNDLKENIKDEDSNGNIGYEEMPTESIKELHQNTTVEKTEDDDVLKFSDSPDIDSTILPDCPKDCVLAEEFESKSNAENDSFQEEQIGEDKPSDNFESNDWFQPTVETLHTQPQIFTEASYFSEEPPEDTTDNVKQSTPASVSIFNDEPPDDDDFFATFPIPKKPQLHSDILFSEEPPEDDTFISSAPEIPSTIFSDEPPPDDALKNIRTTKVFYDDIDETKSNLKNEIKTTTTNNSVADLIRKVTKPVETIPRKESPKIKKLTSSAININVTALLPGAKRSKPLEEDSSLGNSPSLLNEEEVTSVSSDAGKLDSLKTTQTVSDGQITHITKNRSKGMPRRRPSTRKGRQEMYKKSLVSVPGESQVADTQTQVLPNKPAKNTNLFSSSDEDFCFKPSALNNSRKKSEPKIESRKTSEVVQKKVVEKSRGLFSSDEEDDDQLFSEKTKSKPKMSVPKTPALKDNLFDDSENDDDDLFGENRKKSENKVTGKSKSSYLKSNPATKESPNPKQGTSKSTDNPLADLL